MMKQRVFAIFVGALMILSVVGWAMVYVIPKGNNVIQFPHIVTKKLTPEERVYVLQTGRVLIEYFYSNQTDNPDRKIMYENFVTQYKDYAVLEEIEVPENETLEQIIGKFGDSQNLGNVTESDLFPVFCNLAIATPNECLLLEV